MLIVFGSNSHFIHFMHLLHNYISEWYCLYSSSKLIFFKQRGSYVKTWMCGLAKRSFNILSRAGPNRQPFDIFDKEFVDRHWQSSVVDRLFVVESKFVNDIVELSVKEVWWRCRSVLEGFMFVTDEVWRGCFQPCVVAFYAGCRCWLAGVGCRCWLSGVGVGQVLLVVVVGCPLYNASFGCLSLSMVVVGSWLSIVWCWPLIVGFDCRSFFPFVGAQLWLSDSQWIYL